MDQRLSRAARETVVALTTVACVVAVAGYAQEKATFIIGGRVLNSRGEVPADLIVMIGQDEPGGFSARSVPVNNDGRFRLRQLRRARDWLCEQHPAFAIVRYLADESETVFGQRLATKYRVTDTFLRDRSNWKLIALHVSVVTIDPPAQVVSRDGWPRLAGRYQLAPDGWTFHVVLRDGELYGGRDPNALKRLIPLSRTAFVREGTLGEWLFVVGPDKAATRIVDLRKFEPLVWTRVADR